ncbi:MAG: hypothetical protein QNJ84_10700 [Alphaproteobacteria bacterium]|nr:hypothetical protein [Alphaproteobacteria bacterium]
MGVEEAHHFRGGLETPSGEAFKRFFHDRAVDRVGMQDFSAILRLDIAVAEDNAEAVIAAFGPRAHFLPHLTPVLFPLKLALRGGDGLEELAFRAVLKTEIKAFARRPALGHDAAKLQMKLCIAGVALEIVEDHHIAFIRFGVQIGEQGDHARPFHKVAAAGHVIGEDGFDLVALGLGILATAMLLAVQAVSFLALLRIGHPAIDDRFLRICFFYFWIVVHDSSLSNAP